MIKHPLNIRRRAFLTHKLKTGQSIAAWMAQHRELGSEADLEQLSTDDMYCLTYVTAMSHVPDLGDKLLDCVDPNLEKYDEIIEAYVLKQGVKSGLTDGQQATAASVRESQPRDSKEEKERNQGVWREEFALYVAVQAIVRKHAGEIERRSVNPAKRPGMERKHA